MKSMNPSKFIRASAAIFVAALLAGCATYVTPGGPVSLSSIDDTTIREAYARQPASPFPANLAVVRVQDSSYIHRHQNSGRFTIVSTRDIETAESVERIGKLPLLGNVAPISRLLVPANASYIRDLRQPAAQLQADMLLIYSVDTRFTVDGHSFGPLSAISLGLIPNKKAHVTATVSGVLVDVRTGYIYGATEASSTEHQRTTVWATHIATERARLKAEKSAYAEFVSEFGKLWTGTLATYAGKQARGAQLPTDGWYSVDLDE